MTTRPSKFQPEFVRIAEAAVGETPEEWKAGDAIETGGGSRDANDAEILIEIQSEDANLNAECWKLARVCAAQDQVL